MNELFDPTLTAVSAGIAIAGALVGLLFDAPAFFLVGGIFAGLMLWLAWEIAHAMKMPE